MDAHSIKEQFICPLIDKKITTIDCMENQDSTDGFIKESSVPSAYKVKNNWKGICKKCKYHTGM